MICINQASMKSIENIFLYLSVMIPLKEKIHSAQGKNFGFSELNETKEANKITWSKP
jgi:hypothetical protein